MMLNNIPGKIHPQSSPVCLKKLGVRSSEELIEKLCDFFFRDADSSILYLGDYLVLLLYYSNNHFSSGRSILNRVINEVFQRNSNLLLIYEQALEIFLGQL